MLEGKSTFSIVCLSLYNKVEMKLSKIFSTLLLFFIRAITFMIDLGYVSPLFLPIIPREVSIIS